MQILFLQARENHKVTREKGNRENLDFEKHANFIFAITRKFTWLLEKQKRQNLDFEKHANFVFASTRNNQQKHANFIFASTRNS